MGKQQYNEINFVFIEPAALVFEEVLNGKEYSYLNVSKISEDLARKVSRNFNIISKQNEYKSHLETLIKQDAQNDKETYLFFSRYPIDQLARLN